MMMMIMTMMMIEENNVDVNNECWYYLRIFVGNVFDHERGARVVAVHNGAHVQLHAIGVDWFAATIGSSSIA